MSIIINGHIKDALNVPYDMIAHNDEPLYTNGYDNWCAGYSNLTEMYGPGVLSVDEAEGSFVFTGIINRVNYENVSTRATHHGIT